MDNIDEITRLAYAPFSWKSGPDELMPADSFFSHKLDIPVKLRSKETDQKKYPILSLFTAFKQTVTQGRDHLALAYKENNVWVYLTYLEYWEKCARAARSFIKLGLQPSQVVSIIGFNSPEWFIANLGCMFAGGVTCGVYTTNSVEACEHVFKDCKSEIVVVENKHQLDKILKCKENNIPIKKIIQYRGQVDIDYNGLVISWNEFIELGKDVSSDELDQRIKLIAPNKCATLIYTSGTTGTPKAAMISHDSIVYLVRNIGTDQSRLKMFSERFVSYLPLSHIAAQAVDIYASLYLGATVYFAQPDALKGSLAETLKEAKPTFFFGVPRVWEKLQETVEKNIKTLTGTKLKMFKWAQNTSYSHLISLFNRNDKLGLSFYIAKALVLNKVHAAMGFDECRTFISGAAPITKETLDFFIKLGIPLTETFGMSESCGPHTVGTVFSNRVTSVGSIDQYNRSKISNKDHEGSGELCLYGRNVFMGYLNNEEKTAETFDSDGWLRTGDTGKIDSDGFIFITGRIKELVITAGGENIAPVPIEDRVKLELSQLVSNCILVGDKRKYLVILICLKSKVDSNTQEPIDDLTNETIAWLRSIGSESTKVSDILDHKDSVVYKEIENGIKRANEYSTSRAAKVQKFEILPRDFSLANGELGPTLKLKRHIIHKMYSAFIDKLYADDSSAE